MTPKKPLLYNYTATNAGMLGDDGRHEAPDMKASKKAIKKYASISENFKMLLTYQGELEELPRLVSLTNLKMLTLKISINNILIKQNLSVLN